MFKGSPNEDPVPCLFHILNSLWQTDVMCLREKRGCQPSNKSHQGENSTWQMVPYFFKKHDQGGYRHTYTGHEGGVTQSILPV